MEESSPPTVAGAVADLAEALPHSHLVDLATNEPERVYNLINFARVNIVGRRPHFDRVQVLSSGQIYPARIAGARDSRNRAATPERIDQPDNLARSDQPDQ